MKQRLRYPWRNPVPSLPAWASPLKEGWIDVVVAPPTTHTHRIYPPLRRRRDWNAISSSYFPQSIMRCVLGVCIWNFGYVWIGVTDDQAPGVTTPVRKTKQPQYALHNHSDQWLLCFLFRALFRPTAILFISAVVSVVFSHISDSFVYILDIPIPNSKFLDTNLTLN